MDLNDQNIICGFQMLKKSASLASLGNGELCRIIPGLRLQFICYS